MLRALSPHLALTRKRKPRAPQALEGQCEACDARVAALERLELPVLGGLQDRLDMVSTQQVRGIRVDLKGAAERRGRSRHGVISTLLHWLRRMRVQSKFAQSMQEVVTALVDDATDVSRELRAAQARVDAQAQQLDHTREALARCATVFSALHGVPSPVPVAALTSRGAALDPDLLLAGTPT